MNTIRTAVAAAGLAVAIGVLSGCSAEGDAPTPASPTSDAAATSGAGEPDGAGATGTDAPEGGAGAGSGVETPDEERVEAALRAYQSAIVARDFAGACAIQAEETSQQLVELVNSQGGAVGTCPEALARVFEQPGTIEVATESAQSTEIDDVSIDGNTATVRWNHTIDGEPATDSVMMRSVAGNWLILPTA